VQPAAPLSGICVVTLAPNIPGPVAAARMRELGAGVRKIESPAGDMLERIAPGWYAALHEGIPIEKLDLKSESGREELAGRLATADVLLTSSRPSSLARIGLSWDAVHARHPRLTYVAIVGAEPPFEEYAGHDLTYVAELGILDPPAMPKTLTADLAGAERAVSTACALLLARERTGLAGHEVVSLREAGRSFGDPPAYGLTTQSGILGGSFAGYRIYRTSDGWIALAALEDHFWRRLHDTLELPFPASIEALEAAFARRGTKAWVEWSQTHDIPLAPVLV
jgi:alpha-methylacyl-CoA racemase